MFSMKNKRIKMLCTSIVLVSLVASCAKSSAVDTEPTVVENSSVIESSANETTTEITEEETTPTSFTVVTEPHENPLADYILDNPNKFANDTCYIVNPYNLKVDVNYGFDNPFTLKMYRDYVYEVTGIENDTTTLSDVGYFQGNGYLKNSYGKHKFNSEGGFGKIHIEAIRAILISEGLRFGIDEIPASYFLERFPRFTYDAMVFNAWNKCAVEDWEATGHESTDPMLFESMSELTYDLDSEYELFRACLIYNGKRCNYMYNNPWGGGVVIQVRDAVTGKNVLTPSESQAEKLQEDINSIPGCENIDIFTPETPEDFYASYGYYPNELVDKRYIDNTHEGFAEYYNSLPESDQNELYAPILFGA